MELTDTLARIGPDLRALPERWWLIGSAAMTLHGVDLGKVGDVDVLTTPAGARWLASRWEIEIPPATSSDRFRSQLFFKRTDTPLKVEVMAGFEVKTPDGWTPVTPESRLAIEWAGGAYFVPSREDLLEQLRLFDRPKDHQRAALLRAL